MESHKGSLKKRVYYISNRGRENAPDKRTPKRCATKCRAWPLIRAGGKQLARTLWSSLSNVAADGMSANSTESVLSFSDAIMNCGCVGENPCSLETLTGVFRVKGQNVCNLFTNSSVKSMQREKGGETKNAPGAKC